MEESEKRRQRLMAMRMEASQAGVFNGPEPSGYPTGGLTNPLIEKEAISTSPLQYSAPRFDFYTDPMSAFSGNKRRNNIPPQVSQRQHNIPPQVSQGHHNIPPRTPFQGMPPNPVHQNLGPTTFQAPEPHFNQGPPRSPVDLFRRPQAYPPPARAWGPPPPNFYQGNDFTGPRFGQGDPGLPRAPMEVSRPFGTPQGNPPRPWGGSGDSFKYTTTPNSYRGTSPSFGNQGRNQGYSSSPHYGSGRGRGRTSGSGPSGRKGGRGHGSTSAELRPDKYYSKQMVEDPWKCLAPVIWEHGEVQDSEQPERQKAISTSADARDSEVSWPPKSISTKKAKYMAGSSNQPSLAEYLAASFNDPTADEDEQGS